MANFAEPRPDISPGRLGACLVLLCPVVLVACSTFSPAPLYDPPYYIDDYGRVFYPEGNEPWRTDGLALGYGSIPSGAQGWNPYFTGIPGLIDRPVFGSYYGGRYGWPVFRPPAYRPPAQMPGTGGPPGDPALPADPVMSALPVAPPVRIIRYQPEPGDRSRTIGNRPFVGQGPSARGDPGGARGHRPAAPRSSPRSASPKPGPRPAPGRPREIDPR